MKREYPDVPLVGVGAIIIEQDRVVLVKRGQAPLAGEWSIPGGVLELGETLRQAAVREAREETCLTVETADLLGVYDRVLRDEANAPTITMCWSIFFAGGWRAKPAPRATPPKCAGSHRQ